jgi:polyisoprenoid-binding protein YceI
MKTFAGFFCLLVAALAAFEPAAAQTIALTVDPAQTKVEYTLGALLHTVHGTFALKRGNISFDSTGKAQGELTVDATSGKSGSDGRDQRMHKEILESAKYPEIVFRPDRIVGAVAPEGKSKVQLHGTFTIHGGDHEMTVPADIEASGGQYKATVQFTVPYVQWGIKNPSTFLLKVDDKVQLTVIAVARVQSQP